MKPLPFCLLLGLWLRQMLEASVQVSQLYEDSCSFQARRSGLWLWEEQEGGFNYIVTCAIATRLCHHQLWSKRSKKDTKPILTQRNKRLPHPSGRRNIHSLSRVYLGSQRMRPWANKFDNVCNVVGVRFLRGKPEPAKHVHFAHTQFAPRRRGSIYRGQSGIDIIPKQGKKI